MSFNSRSFTGFIQSFSKRKVKRFITYCQITHESLSNPCHRHQDPSRLLLYRSCQYIFVIRYQYGRITRGPNSLFVNYDGQKWMFKKEEQSKVVNPKTKTLLNVKVKGNNFCARILTVSQYNASSRFDLLSTRVRRFIQACRSSSWNRPFGQPQGGEP